MLIQERIQLIIKMNNLTPSVFADKIGVQRSSISHVLSGRNKPGLDFLEKILIHFPRVNAHWLITGEQKLSDSENLNAENLNQKSNVNEVSINNPDIDKVILFYKNGTFKAYLNIQ